MKSKQLLSFCMKSPGLRATCFSLMTALFLTGTVQDANAIEVDNKSTFVVGKYIFKIGDEVDAGEAWLVGVKEGTTLEGEITIPGSATINGTKYTVTRIGNYRTDISDRMAWYNYEAAIADMPAITKINIPSTITVISTEEFIGCTGITEFHVNASNPEFKDDNGILMMNMSAIEDIKSWGLFRMPPATKKTRYTLPSGVSILNNAFADTRTIKTIVITNQYFSERWSGHNKSINTIDVSSSDRYTSLNGIIYNDDDWIINNDSYSKYGIVKACPPGLVMETVTLPASTKYIYNGAFYNTSVSEVIIPETITNISNFAFANSTIKSLKINVNNLEDPQPTDNPDMFGLCLDCKNLESVEFTGDKNKKMCINYHAFHGCENLKSFTAASQKITLMGYAFYGCSSLTSFPFAQLSEVPVSIEYMLGYQFAYSGLTSARIPSFFVSVPEGMFMGSALKTVNLNPSGKDNLRRIGKNAFKDCRLTSVDLAQISTLGEECFAGNPLSTVIFHPARHIDSRYNRTSIGRDAFTLADNAWFYISDRATDWDITDYDAGNFKNATFVSSAIENNVPKEYATVYCPATLAEEYDGTGNVHELFTVNPYQSKGGFVIRPTEAGKALNLNITKVLIDGEETINEGDLWYLPEPPFLVRYSQLTMEYTVNGKDMYTYFYGTTFMGTDDFVNAAVDAVKADESEAAVEGVYSIDGRRLGDSIENAPSGMIIVRYTDGSAKKIINNN